VIGLPATILGPRFLTHPVVALPLWAGTYFVWHVPAVYDYALRHQVSVLHLEHLSYFVTGCLFWWPALRDEPHRLSYGARAMYVFAAFVVASPLGLMLALIPRAIYDYYVQAPRLWGLSPLTDQQIGGGAMALEQAAVLFAVGTFYFLRFLSGEARADTFRALNRRPPRTITAGDEAMDAELVRQRARARAGTRGGTLRSSALGPLTALAGLAWALVQPYRITLLDPDKHTFWSLAVQPPLARDPRRRGLPLLGRAGPARRPRGSRGAQPVDGAAGPRSSIGCSASASCLPEPLPAR
jgi:hypothetical protein